ncbi:hypothetical protein VFPPC_04433 [Pochonia chlamydosporia 170]|uniref:Uncharacterized protein n=1 Tax=Pochonia chlamydosporia 170 TaxID=1380566 RepID=A0A179FSU6_METCM|nr:hypothetical protein VFPPC_04433 [Pochonia chlamydosporia 170]OAQ68163.1 hypothetical protein VFPPC_04433 [Pochonia chlamydosporia 170]
MSGLVAFAQFKRQILEQRPSLGYSFSLVDILTSADSRGLELWDSETQVHKEQDDSGNDRRIGRVTSRLGE